MNADQAQQHEGRTTTEIDGGLSSGTVMIYMSTYTLQTARRRNGAFAAAAPVGEAPVRPPRRALVIRRSPTRVERPRGSAR